MKLRDKTGRYRRNEENFEENTPLFNVWRGFVNFLNYLVLFLGWLPWLLVFYFILSYVDYRRIFHEILEVFVCRCKDRRDDPKEKGNGYF